MAGIGFVLKKLSQQDNLIGWARAHINSAILATGPWLFTILAFWAITWSVSSYMPMNESMRFTIIIIYNFSFSSVFCGLLTLISTRYIADCIFAKDTMPIPGLMVGTIAVTMITQTPLAVWFYFFELHMDSQLAWLSVVNYLIISMIWLTSVYLTAIKNYHSISIAFGAGLLIAIGASYVLGFYFSTNGVMAGFNIGLGCCLGLIIASILSEYPFPFRATLGIFGYMRKYWILVLSGLAYNLAIWVDKWIMWYAPEATVTDSGIRVNFCYDSAMFLAYLTIIPALGVFVFSLETNFHEKYLIFYNDINRRVNFAKIRENQFELIATLKSNINNFVAFQGIFSVVIVLMSSKLMSTLDISMLRLGIFRFGVIGVFFHMMALFLTIILSYFDCQKSILVIQIVFLVTNAAFTYITMKTDFVYYGMGYMVASMITFALASMITIAHLKLLPYHTFITNNTSLRS